MRIARHSLLLLRLTLLGWWRGSLTVRRDVAPPKRGSAILLRLLTFVGAGVQASAVAALCRASEPSSRMTVFGVAFAALIGAGFCWGAGSRSPAIEGAVQNRPSRFLDTLPLSEVAKCIVPLVALAPLYVAGTAFMHGATGRTWPVSAALGVAIGVASMSLGMAFVGLTRALSSGTFPARAAPGYRFGFVGCLILAQTSRILGESVAIARYFPWIEAIPRTLTRGRSGTIDLLMACIATIVVAVFVIVLAERIGYDRAEVSLSKKLRAETELTIEKVDAVIASRAPGGFFVKSLTFLLGAAIAFGYVMMSWRAHVSALPETRESLPSLGNVLAFVSAFMTAQLASVHALNAASRDSLARPFLSTLPIAPNVLLHARARARVRSALATLALPAIALAIGAFLQREFEPLWRSVVLVIAGVLSARSAVAVSFLRSGGETQPTGVRAVPRLEAFLIIFPTVTAVAAPNLASALVGLLLVWLVGREAKKTALAYVRWVQDADDFERATETWRAALVLSVFFAAQALAGFLVGAFDHVRLRSLAIQYTVSAAVLVLFARYERRDETRVPFRVRSLLDLFLGALGGVLSAAAAYGYVAALRHFDVKLPSDVDTTEGAGWLAVSAIVIAPIAEEYFFRGVLQASLQREYGATSRVPIVVISAFLFAALHPPLSFVPVFLLGLVAAIAYRKTGSILPGIVAHVIHNAAAALVIGR